MSSQKEDELDVSISTSQHRNAIRSSSYAASIVQKVSEKHEMDINQINIISVNESNEKRKLKSF